ncbi:MAG: putative selenate ABC transporter substrate-binding protein [Gammaproteobacteria bacterium]
MTLLVSRRSAVALLVGAAASLQAAHAQRPTFYFSAIPDEDETKLTARFTKVAAYLTGELGFPVQYVPLKSYPASVTAFKNDQIQLAWFGGLTGVQAQRAAPGSQAIAQGEEDKAFVSYFIANAATGIELASDLPKAIAGKTFTFGAKTSTSGRLMPEFYLRKAFGKSPDEIFSKVGYSGDHTKTVELVQSGAYDVGACNYSSFDDMVKNGKADPAKVKVIWKTPPFPDYNWTIRGDVDKRFGAGTLAKVRAAILGIKDPALLAAFPRKSFIPAQNADYKPIEETAKLLGLLD